MLLPLLLVANRAVGQGRVFGTPGTVGGKFEVDGNFENNGAPDWQNVLKPGSTAGLVVPGVNPTTGSFWIVDGNDGPASTQPEQDVFKGNKNNNDDDISAAASPFRFETDGRGASPNGDLTNIYGHIALIGGKLWFVFGAEARLAIGGTYFDFEYNQRGIRKETATGQLIGNGAQGGRTVGDLLLVVNYSFGLFPSLALRRWEAQGAGYAWSAPLPLPDDAAYVTLNAEEVEAVAPNRAFARNGAPSSTTKIFQFVEGAINLTDLHVLPPSACGNNASTMLVKTRAANNYTSRLEDFSLFNVSLGSLLPPPLLTIQGNPVINCQSPDNQTKLIAIAQPGTGTYAWSTSNGHIVSGADAISAVIDRPGTYSVTFTSDLNGCSATSQIQVREDKRPPIVSAGPDKAITCATPNGLVTLEGSAASQSGVDLLFSYVWVASNGGHIVSGANTATPIVDAAGTYTLTATEPAPSVERPAPGNGCSASDEVKVTKEGNFPPLLVRGPTVLNCGRSEATLFDEFVLQAAGSTYTVTTSGGQIVVANDQTGFFRVNKPDTYTITKTSPEGCSSRQQFTVTEDKRPPIVSAGPDKIITCTTPNRQVTLDGSGVSQSPFVAVESLTFAWVASNGGHIVSGANMAKPTVDAAGTYTLTVTEPFFDGGGRFDAPGNGCSASDAAQVTLQCASLATTATQANQRVSHDNYQIINSLQVYPNPLSDKAILEFALPDAQQYSLEIFDLKGRLVSRISAGRAEANQAYRFEIGENMASGIYVARLKTRQSTESLRIVVQK
ncbi:T9SS type A sorting domain-containing protein [Hymenobacter sp. BT491]|uniref:T9SS type A sorting domain-containing protein n=1 Tax=Hymenobacter sp. BT491 TaxID=2766779 RepID=UPI001653BCD9|nr:T9SS type A sorting domain-containing protein [Hymenobacter sp. BT491]